MRLQRPARVATLSLVAAVLSACGGSSTPVQPAGVTVAVKPPAAQTQPSGQVGFLAAVTGTLDTSVRWSVREAGGGTIDTTGSYTAPGVAGVFHVVAVSVADPTASGSAQVTVSPPPVAVTVTPTTAAVDACLTLALTATVTGTANTAVTWSVLEGAAGGSISPAGVYTASDTAGVYHLVATSVADPGRSATATVTVTERVLSVQVTPASVAIPAGGTAQFTATVTTTCGAFATVTTLDAAGRVVRH